MVKQMGRLVMSVAVMWACSFALQAEQIDVHVLGVVDGDTVKIRDENGVKYYVTLSGVDAPELPQAHGRAAKDFLCWMVCGRDVTLQFNKMNPQGHVIGSLSLGEDDVNAALLRNGMAWHDMNNDQSTSRAEYGRYARAESEARKAGAGLWQDGVGVVAPWRWRRIAKLDLW